MGQMFKCFFSTSYLQLHSEAPGKERVLARVVGFHMSVASHLGVFLASGFDLASSWFSWLIEDESAVERLFFPLSPFSFSLSNKCIRNDLKKFLQILDFTLFSLAINYKNIKCTFIIEYLEFKK